MDDAAVLAVKAELKNRPKGQRVAKSVYYAGGKWWVLGATGPIRCKSAARAFKLVKEPLKKRVGKKGSKK